MLIRRQNRQGQKKPRSGFSKKPNFIPISNIYDNLEALVDSFGITQVINHLGQIASEKISKELASRLWYVTSSQNKFDGTKTDEVD